MIGIYARVSTQEQVKGYSIDEQIDRLKKYCDAIGHKDINIYIDPGFSGASIKRPELQRLIEDVKSGKIEKVLVYKLDRLSRSQKDTLYLIEDVFLKNGVHFESVSERFDTGTALGMAMIGILAVFAQLEREQIKERMSIGIEGRAKSGKYHGSSFAPIGYDYMDGELVINEFEAMQVKLIYEKFSQGMTRYALERYMAENGYKTRYGFWNKTGIKRALENKIYIGKINFKGQVYDGLHKPIITQELFDRVQERLKETTTQAYKPGIGLLSGLLWCKHCGGRYGRFKNRKNKDGIRYEYYTCYSRNKVSPSMIKDPNCKSKSYKVEVLNDLILEEVKKLSLDPDYMEQLADHTEEQDNIKNIEIIRKEINRLSAQRSRLIDLYSVGGIPVEDLSEKVKNVNMQMDALFAEMDALAKDGKITFEEARDRIKDFKGLVEEGNREEIANVIKSLIDRIEIGNDEITIKWKFT